MNKAVLTTLIVVLVVVLGAGLLFGGMFFFGRHDYKNAIKIYKLILQLDPERKDIIEKIKKAKGESEAQ